MIMQHAAGRSELLHSVGLGLGVERLLTPSFVHFSSQCMCVSVSWLSVCSLSVSCNTLIILVGVVCFGNLSSHTPQVLHFFCFYLADEMFVSRTFCLTHHKHQMKCLISKRKKCSLFKGVFKIESELHKIMPLRTRTIFRTIPFSCVTCTLLLKRALHFVEQKKESFRNLHSIKTQICCNC